MLYIQAYDNYQFGFTTGQSRLSFMQLAITIADVNDEKPEFVEVADQCSTVTEFHEQVGWCNNDDDVMMTM